MSTIRSAPAHKKKVEGVGVKCITGLGKIGEIIIECKQAFASLYSLMVTVYDVFTQKVLLSC